MKRVTVLVVALVMSLCLVGLLSGCSSQDYTPQKKSQVIKDSSLNTKETLRVGVDASNAPYAVESSGVIVGIDVDIAAALADELGLKLELVDVGTDVANAFSKEDVDIVMGVKAQGSSYWLSESYMSSAVALFSPSSSTKVPAATDTFTVAAQSSSMSAWEVSDRLGQAHLKTANDLQGAFSSLSSGSVNFVAADSTIGAYVAHSSNVEAYPIALLQDPVSYGIAVSSENTAVQSAVSKALASLKSGGIVSVIEKKWLGDPADLSALSLIQSQVTPATTTPTTTS